MKRNFKKMVTVLVLSIVVLHSISSKEYTWGSGMRWNNNNPDVVKTMPTVKNATKSWGIDLKSVEFIDIEEADQKVVDAVLKYAEKNALLTPDLGQFIYYNDVSNIFIIVNFEVSEISGENVIVGHFIQKLQKLK